MFRFAAMFTLLANLSVASNAFAIDPDPSKLLPTAEQAIRAKELSRKLGDPVFQVRHEASKELKKLGTASLPILKETLQVTPDPEVRNRCELLLPAIELAAIKLRLETFLADHENKYDHQLPGWKDFREIAGTDEKVKMLFASMYATTPNRELLTLRDGSSDVFWTHVLARRMQLSGARSSNVLAARLIVLNGRNVVEAPTASSRLDLADVVGLLFAESNTKLIGSLQNSDRAYYYTASNLLRDPNIMQQLQSEEGAAFRKLVAHWMDSRENAVELYNMVSLATSLNIKEAPVAKYAEKVFSTSGVTPSVKMSTITILARANDKAHLPIFAKIMSDKSEFTTTRIVNRVREERTIQVRDMALIMSLYLTDQRVEDYGIQFTPPSTSPSALTVYKYIFSYYHVPDDKTREAAFKKWDAWVATQKKEQPKK